MRLITSQSFDSKPEAKAFAEMVDKMEIDTKISDNPPNTVYMEMDTYAGIALAEAFKKGEELDYDALISRCLEKAGEIDVMRDNEVLTLCQVPAALADLDWQRVFDMLNDYYQAVRITPNDRFADGLARSLGLELLRLLHEASQDIKERVENSDERAKATVNVVVPERLGLSPRNLAQELAYKWFSVSVSTGELSETMWQFISSDAYDYFDAATDFDEYRTSDFYAYVDEIGLFLANEIKGGIATYRTGQMLGNALTDVFKGRRS